MVSRNWLGMGLALLLGAACSGEAARADPAQNEAPPQTASKRGTPRANPSSVAELGKPAPDFTLVDTDGKTHALSDLRGKTVVLEWFNPDCPFVRSAHEKGALRTLAKERQSAEVVWLAINSSAPGKQGHGRERNVAAKAEYGMVNPVLLDETGKVGRAYGAEKTPHMFVIDPKGVLVYRGGLDNAPMGVVDDERPRPKGSAPGTVASYLTAALDALAQAKPPELSDTPAYGCSVKYGN